MIIIEAREAAYDKAFDLLDEAKLYSKKQKMVLCALEDAIYDCYESSKDEEYDEHDEDSYEDREEFEIPSDGEEEMNYRFRQGRRGYRSMRGGMRHYGERNYRKGMRRNMRKSM